MRYLILLPLALCACVPLPPAQGPSGHDETQTVQPALDPTPPPPPPPMARTAQQFDTTSQDDRAAALDVDKDAGEQKLGRTVASLGAPGDPGIWLKTSFVDRLQPGRVEVVGTGATANLELRPQPDSTGSASQISLPAMRLLDLSLTDLPELDVFAK